MRVFPEALSNFRNRLTANSAFRERVQKIPLIQWFARRQARRLFGLASGFIHSQILLACVRLGILERLRDGPAEIATLAHACAMTPSSMGRLVHSGAALRLLELRGDGRCALGPLGAAVCGNEGLQLLVEHHGLLYQDIADPVALFTGTASPTRIARLWPYAGAALPRAVAADDAVRYTQLMAASQTMIASQVLDAFSLRSRRTLLDVGGGAGAFAEAAVRRWPDLAVTVADLPAVAGIARDRLAAHIEAGRVSVAGVDAFSEALPRGFDAVSLIRVIHDHDDERAVMLLRRARSSLAEGGVLLVAEPLADQTADGRLIEAYFNVYLLAMGSGRPRSPVELKALLRRAGFARVRRYRTDVPLMTSLLVARQG